MSQSTEFGHCPTNISLLRHTPVYVIGAEVEQVNNIRFLEINITENLFLIWETDRAYLILCAISFALAICLHYNHYQYGHIFTYCTENLHRYSEYNFKPSQIRCILIWHVRGSGGSILTYVFPWDWCQLLEACLGISSNVGAYMLKPFCSHKSLTGQKS